MTGYARVLEMDAAERERVSNAVLAWIKEDAPLSAKMNLLPAVLNLRQIVVCFRN